MHPLTHAAEHDQHMTVPQNSSKLAAHANHMPCYHSSNNQCNNASLSLAPTLMLKVPQKRRHGHGALCNSISFLTQRRVA